MVAGTSVATKTPHPNPLASTRRASTGSAVTPSPTDDDDGDGNETADDDDTWTHIDDDEAKSRESMKQNKALAACAPSVEDGGDMTAGDYDTNAGDSSGAISYDTGSGKSDNAADDALDAPDNHNNHAELPKVVEIQDESVHYETQLQDILGVNY